jgi:hypothetical protein
MYLVYISCYSSWSFQNFTQTNWHLSTLDGQDVLKSKQEYTDFNEHGRTFVAFDREPDPLTPQSISMAR